MNRGSLGVLALLMAAAPSPTPLPLPEVTGRIGFDDLAYVRTLDRVLVPAGRSGMLDLVDPRTRAIEVIKGFSTGWLPFGHADGVTTADGGEGLIFASDRNRKAVAVVDPKAKSILSRVDLAGAPDYVRWVGPTREVWVTEPDRKAVEYFRFEPGTPPRLVLGGSLRVPDGPESLVVDALRGRAYSHTWRDETLVLDLKSHKVVARWRNGCEGARGIALDEERGWLFVGCEEGKAVVLDVAHESGRTLATALAGKGVDIIAYAPGLRHLYVPGADSETMTIFAVGENGSLTALATASTAPDAHCVTADASGGIYVCDPKQGRILFFKDELAR